MMYHSILYYYDICIYTAIFAKTIPIKPKNKSTYRPPLWSQYMSNAVDLYLQSLRKFKLSRVKYFVKYFDVRFDFENSFIKECYLIVF